MSEIAISVKNVSKIYKLYDRPIDRLKESLGLSKQHMYKEHYALHDVNIDVKKGETVGIIGTNGSGKSTILKIITGVLNPSQGEVEINGRISALLELGAGFNMEYTGIENVYLNGTMIGFSKEEVDEKLDAILEFADIGEFVHQPVKTYSSGMFVRLAFAVAINIDPEILIVDEALSVGDVFFQAKCYKKFEEFKQMGKTILFVSHDLGSVSKYCDRVVLLNSGIKLAEGLPKDMVDLYKKVLVNQFDDETNEEEKEVDEIQNVSSVMLGDGALWKDSLLQNPDLLEYGDKRVEIVDYGVFDNDKLLTSTVVKGNDFTIKIKIKTSELINDPIVAFTIKDVHGTEITGTNTMFEKVYLGTLNAGEERTISFKQKLHIQGGQYLISLGCTGYQNDDFVVYHRLYDVINLSIVSEKNTVGYYDMFSKVTVE